jgi:hypothetical protein
MVSSAAFRRCALSLLKACSAARFNYASPSGNPDSIQPKFALKARISRKRQVQRRSIAIVVAIAMSIVAGNAQGNAGHRLSAKAPFTRGNKVAI